MNKKQLFAAMDAYLSNKSCDDVVLESQVKADLDLVLSCYSIAQKHPVPTTSAEENAELVVFEVLNWYPYEIRSKIAQYLLDNCPIA